MLQMIGHVRLVRLPSAVEASPDVTLPAQSARQPASSVSKEAAGPPPSAPAADVPQAHPLCQVGPWRSKCSARPVSSTGRGTRSN